MRPLRSYLHDDESVKPVLGATLALGLLVALASALGLADRSPAEPPAGASGLIATGKQCPGQGATAANPSRARKAILCMVNVARKRSGLPRLGGDARLNRAASSKAKDILRCDDFSHEACGREFAYWFERTGYLDGCGSAGENIAWGTGSLGRAGSILRGWMRSPGHRENILGEYEELGVGVREGRLDGASGAQVWVQAFGSRC